jgi:hypothetical protein
MIHAQSPVAIRALPDLCLGISSIESFAPADQPGADGKSRPVACPWRVGALRKCVVLAIRINGPRSDFGGSSCRATRSYE